MKGVFVSEFKGDVLDEVSRGEEQGCGMSHFQPNEKLVGSVFVKPPKGSGQIGWVYVHLVGQLLDGFDGKVISSHE